MKLVNVMILVLVVATCSFAQNLLMNGGMESEEGWNAVHYNADSQPSYMFNYDQDSLRFGQGGALFVEQDGPSGQLLLYQRVTCIAGKQYRATGAIKLLDFDPATDTFPPGPWYQYYISTEEPDPEANDFNPKPGKMFDISAWNDCNDLFEFDGLWESINCAGQYDTTPYWTCPGEEGEEVEVTVGIKVGQWGDEPGYFAVLIDEVGFYPVESNMLVNGGMESEDGWNAVYYNADSQPSYMFNYDQDSLRFGQGGALFVEQEGPSGQLLLYQRVTCTAGEQYRASGAIKLLDFDPATDTFPPGPWYQYYISTEEPDPEANDFNPKPGKMFDISAWNDCNDLFEFDGLWECINCAGQYDTAPYWTCPGEKGEQVEVTVGMKLGQWGDDPGYFAVLVDEVMFFPVGEAGTTSAVQANPIHAQSFELSPAWPNPFNPSTSLRFTLPATQHITATVYDINGRLITELANDQFQAGSHHLYWNGKNHSGMTVPSGIYFIHLASQAQTAVQKVTLIK